MNAPTQPGELALWADRDTPKSRRTRLRILDAAMRLFAEIGFHTATNAAIADHAKLTRGAMLYHFPTREALLASVVEHIQSQRSSLLKAASDGRPAGVDAAEHAIDVYWRLLKTPPFQAFSELEAAARTDETLRRLMAPAQAEFDRAEAGDEPLALLHAGVGPRLQTSRDLARFMLEGMAKARMTHDEEAREARLLAVIKRATQMLNRKGMIADLWPE